MIVSYQQKSFMRLSETLEWKEKDQAALDKQVNDWLKSAGAIEVISTSIAMVSLNGGYGNTYRISTIQVVLYRLLPE